MPCVTSPSWRSESLGITYNGPALEHHTIDVRTLAPSLLALADALQIAQAALDPDIEPPTVQVVASPRAGSFVLDLLVTSGLLTQHLLTSMPATAVANMGGLVQSFKSATSTVKWLRNRPASKVPQPDGTIRYVTADGDTLDIPAEASTILETPNFRARINSVIEPVRRPGIDSLRIDSPQNDEVPIIIESDDAEAFTPPLTDDQNMVVTEREILVNIVTVPFRRGLKWKLNDGTTTFTADLNDPYFRQRIHDRQVVFAEGDQLRIELREIQKRDPSTAKLTTLRTIERVIRHIPSPEQGQLFGTDGH